MIGIDNIDQIFQYPEIAAEFLPLLRSWHEEANVSLLWQYIRLLITHSTEIYLSSLVTDQSPFNVGLPIQLPEFNREQVQYLTQVHKLDWLRDESLENLMNMVGGHPYLIRLAMYHLSRGLIDLEKLLQEAPTFAGIYRDHLHSCSSYLHKKDGLVEALRQVVQASRPVQLEWFCAHQLESIGLIKFDRHRVKISCEIYQQYFSNQFL